MKMRSPTLQLAYLCRTQRSGWCAIERFRSREDGGIKLAQAAEMDEAATRLLWGGRIHNNTLCKARELQLRSFVSKLVN